MAVSKKDKPYPFFVVTEDIYRRLFAEIGHSIKSITDAPHYQFSRWLNENTNGNWYDGYSEGHNWKYGMFFELELDAMAFKLRWS